MKSFIHAASSLLKRIRLRFFIHQCVQVCALVCINSGIRMHGQYYDRERKKERIELSTLSEIKSMNERKKETCTRDMKKKMKMEERGEREKEVK
jgi:hypothetical protein